MSLVRFGHKKPAKLAIKSTTSSKRSWGVLLPWKRLFGREILNLIKNAFLLQIHQIMESTFRYWKQAYWSIDPCNFLKTLLWQLYNSIQQFPSERTKPFRKDLNELWLASASCRGAKSIRNCELGLQIFFRLSWSHRKCW